MVPHVHQLKEGHHHFQAGCGIAQSLHPLGWKQLLSSFPHTPCLYACSACLDSHYFTIICVAVTFTLAVTIVKFHFTHGSGELSIRQRGKKMYVLLNLLLQLFSGVWTVEGSCTEAVISVLFLSRIAIVLVCKGQGLDRCGCSFLLSSCSCLRHFNPQC